MQNRKTILLVLASFSIFNFGLLETEASELGTTDNLNNYNNSINIDGTETLQYGDENEEVYQVKLALIKLGFAEWEDPNYFFGPGTEAAVEHFQSYYGLTVSGVMDEVSLNKMDTVLSSPLQRGNTSQAILELKNDIIMLGFADWEDPNGYFGPGTEAAVRRIQSSYNLVVNGIVDEVTQRKIQELKYSPLKIGMSSRAILQLKENLIRLGFADWEDPNEYFGEGTKAAVERFQSYFGLQVTGVMDDNSLIKMDAVLSNPLQRGNSSKAILELKNDIVMLGFADWEDPNDYFGPGTEAVVRRIQSYYNLVVNGIVDEVTQNKLQELRNSPLRKGIKSPKVLQLKEDLIQLGFADWEDPNDYFGEGTEAAVEYFQSYYGIEVTGVMGEASLNKLNEILSNPLQKGTSSQAVLDLKHNINALGFADWENPNTYFGPGTEAAVREIQSSYGLVVNGIVDEVTKKKLTEELKSIPLKRWITRDDVVELEENLIRLGFADWDNPDDYFGESTEAAVEHFQSYYGLSVTGMMDEASVDKMSAVLSTPLQIGNSSQAILELKNDIVMLGFAEWQDPNNYFGPGTQAAVRRIQSYYNLVVNGIVDEVTKKKIQEMKNTPLQIGIKRPDVLQLKEDLIRLGFANWDNPNEYFGKGTQAAVEDFQGYYGLSVTGVMDTTSLNKMSSVFNSLLQKGNSSPEIYELKSNLVKLGFANWDGYNDYYGPGTESTVKEFQRYYGLPASGIMEEVSLRKLNEILTSLLQEGNSSPKIYELKSNLVKLGFANWEGYNDYYGAETESTVKEFQRYYGLPVSGIMEEVSLEKLNEILASPLQEGNSSPEIYELKSNLVRLGFANWEGYNDYYGPGTESTVKEFQRYFGLPVSGIMEEGSLRKINEVLTSPLQFGNSSKDILNLKLNLVKIGFANWTNPNSYFGYGTERVVREFQRYNGLAVSGIVDEVTLDAIQKALKSRGTNYSITLKEAVEMQMNASPQTDKYRNEPAYVSSSYVNITSGGTINGDGVRLRTSPDLDTLENISYTLNSGTAVTIVDSNVKGDSYAGSTVWYKIRYSDEELYVHNSLVNINAKIAITTADVNIRAESSINSHIYATVNKGTTLTILEKGSDWYKIDFTTWRNAKREDVRYYLDPTNFIHDEKQKFQFLDLSRPSGVTVDTLNDYLRGKGILEGQGKAFIDAAIKHGVNDLYLVSHALLETGHGESALARGVVYNGTKVYNMFGIGAYDSCPLECGVRKAYEEGWTTPYKAIVGGARFIGEQYINDGQNTLYKMRWNPEGMEKYGYATHQYATDIGWASKQVYTLYNLYNEVGSYNLLLDYPVYE